MQARTLYTIQASKTVSRKHAHFTRHSLVVLHHALHGVHVHFQLSHLAHHPVHDAASVQKTSRVCSVNTRQTLGLDAEAEADKVTRSTPANT